MHKSFLMQIPCETQPSVLNGDNVDYTKNLNHK